MSWKWVSLEAALAAHQEQIAEHGGGIGVRDVLGDMTQAHRLRLHARGGNGKGLRKIAHHQLLPRLVRITLSALL